MRAVIVAGGGVLVTAGCNAPLSALDPQGPSAAEIGLLGRVMLAAMLAIWIGMILLVLAVMSSRRGLERISLKAWLIGGGLVLPLAVMIPLFVWSVVLTGRLLPDGSEPTRIRVEGSMWAWTFTYPEVPGATSQGTLYLPAGQPVRLEITARDVIHSFWVPRLAGKMDAIPGHLNEALVQADNPGVIEGQCSEYCGQGHQLMRFVVDARPPEDYAAALSALAEGRAPEPAPEWVPPSAVGAAAPSPPLPMPDAGGPLGGPPEAGSRPDPMPPPLPPSAEGAGSPAPAPEAVPTTIPRDSAP